MCRSTSLADFAIPAAAALLLVLAAVFLASCSSTTASSSGENQAAPASTTDATIDATTRDALLAALDDERRAEAFYTAVIKKFGEILPFSNIVIAEQRHQNMLLPLLKKYDVAPPPNPHDPATFEVPATRAQACEMGVQSERDNIALYDRLIPTIKEPDIKAAFEALRSASADRHLPAFERCAGG
jgi:hypothetical protein